MGATDEARAEAERRYRAYPQPTQSLLISGFERGVEWQAGRGAEQLEAVRETNRALTAQLQAAQARIEAAQGLTGLFRAWNATPEQIENLRLVLSRADTSAYDAAIRAAKAEALREASSDLAAVIRPQLIEQTEAE